MAAPEGQNPPLRRKDPLVLLRDFTIARKKIRWSDDYLEFDSQRLHRTTKCGYRTSPVEPFMDIGSVWYMLREISDDKPYTQDTARSRGFRYIGVANRGDLCDYLVGTTEACPGLVREVIEGRKRPRDERDTDPRMMKARAARATASGGKAGVAGAQAKAEEISYADVVARVRPVKDLDVLVRCPGRAVPNVDLILKIAQDEVTSWHNTGTLRPADSQVDIKVPLIQELEKMVVKDPSNRPIILVPCNKNAPVNLLNVAQLLQDGLYYEPTEEKKHFFESTRPEMVEIKRNIMGSLWTFEVRDAIKNFEKSQWLRVVAVVTDGTDWQFKGYPFETLVDMFTTFKGMYFTACGARTPEHVKKWACTILDMSSTQFQHRFGAVRDAFWTEVEVHLRSLRNKKFVNHTTLAGGCKMEKPIQVL